VTDEAEENKAAWNDFLEIFYLVAHNNHLISGVEKKIEKIEKTLLLEKQSNVQSKIEGQFYHFRFLKLSVLKLPVQENEICG